MEYKITYNNYLERKKVSFCMDADKFKAFINDFLCDLAQCYGTLVSAEEYINAPKWVEIAKSGETYKGRDFTITVL